MHPDDLIKLGFSPREDAVLPDGIFENAESIILAKIKRKRIFLFWLMSGTSSLIIASAAFVLSFNSQGDSDQKNHAQQKVYQFSQNFNAKEPVKLDNPKPVLPALQAVSYSKSARNKNDNKQSVNKNRAQHLNKQRSPFIQEKIKTKKESSVKAIPVTTKRDQFLLEEKLFSNKPNYLDTTARDFTLKEEIKTERNSSKSEISSNGEGILVKNEDTAIDDKTLTKSEKSFSKQENMDQPRSPTSSLKDHKNLREPDQNKLGIFANVGPTIFTGSIFAPYLKYGTLHANTLKSSSFEFGGGIFYRFKNNVSISLSSSYGVRSAQLSYSFALNKRDYFNKYGSNSLIDFDELNKSEDCMCYLARDSELEFSLVQKRIGFEVGYNFFSSPRIQFIPSFSFQSVLSSQYNMLSQRVIAFKNNTQENFVQFRYGLKFGTFFELSESFSIGLSPGVYKEFSTEKSALKLSTLEFVVPLELRYKF